MLMLAVYVNAGLSSDSPQKGMGYLWVYIKGANQVGWISFLTQTGVHAGGAKNDA
jgi:hypothetical protein